MGDNAPVKLTTVQRDRACGVLLGTAAGEALAASKCGEWADGTAMAIPVAELAAIQADLRREDIRDRIVERWNWRAQTVKDARVQHPSVVATAPVALAYLDDEIALAAAARAICELIPEDPDARDACVLWCAAIRHAVLTGNPDIRSGLGHLDAERRQRWAERFDTAEHASASAFGAGGGGAAAALQGAWSAIVHTPVPVEEPANEVFRVDHLRLTLEEVVCAGGTVEAAAIAGGLLGAAYGASAVPSDWRLVLRGWPGLRARDLIHLADNIIDKGEPDRRLHYWRIDTQHPGRRHPYDDQVYITGVHPLIRPLQYVPEGVDAIVSLCRVPDTSLRTRATHLDVRLSEGEDENPNLDFVLLDTARAIEQLRADGRTVFLHSMLGTSRAPAVAALYGARKRSVGIDEALRDVCEVIPDADPDSVLRAALNRLAGVA